MNLDTKKDGIDKETKAKLIFALNLIKDINENIDNKIKLVDLLNKTINFTDGTSINIEEDLVKPITNEMTSDVNTTIQQVDFSATSDMPISTEVKHQVGEVKHQVGEVKHQVGGSNSVFKSSKYSETSSAKFSDMQHFSQTSSVNFNARSDKYSDTSIIGQIGGADTEISDTLRSVSELKERSNKYSKSSRSNLDLGIFKKSQSHSQSGGSANNEIKKKMFEAGIHSSSTSSICE